MVNLVAPTTMGAPEGITLSGSDKLLAMGAVPANILRVPANVIDQETVTIGSDVFRVEVVNTASVGSALTTVTGGQVNNTNPGEVHDFYYPAHARVVGDLLSIESEFFLVIGSRNANYLHLRRGVSGSTVASHAIGTAIKVAAASGAGVGIAVGMLTTLTPVVFTAALVADINARGTNLLSAALLGTTAVKVYASDKPGSLNPVARVDTTATTETLTGGSNAWDNTTMLQGIAPSQQYTVSRVPKAAEVTEGNMYFRFPFVPVVDRVTVITTSTLAITVFDGVATVTGNEVAIDNSGSTDWATTSTVEVRVHAA